MTFLIDLYRFHATKYHKGMMHIGTAESGVQIIGDRVHFPTKLKTHKHIHHNAGAYAAFEARFSTHRRAKKV